MNDVYSKSRAIPVREDAFITEKPVLVSVVSAVSLTPLERKLHLQNVLLVTLNVFVLGAYVVSRWTLFQVRSLPPSSGPLTITFAIFFVASCVSAGLGYVSVVKPAQSLVGAAQLAVFTLLVALILQVGVIKFLNHRPRAAVSITLAQLRRACVDDFERSACVTQLHRSPQAADQLTANERSELRVRLVEFRDNYPKSFWSQLSGLQKTSDVSASAE